MAERDEFGAFLIGFIVGGITGAATALLLAPQSGEDTRTFIKEKSIEIKDKAGETLDGAYTQAEATAIEARSRFDDLAKTTKTKAEEIQQKGKVLLEEQKSKLSKKVEDGIEEAAEDVEAAAEA